MESSEKIAAVDAAGRVRHRPAGRVTHPIRGMIAKLAKKFRAPELADDRGLSDVALVAGGRQGISDCLFCGALWPTGQEMSRKMLVLRTWSPSQAQANRVKYDGFRARRGP